MSDPAHPDPPTRKPKRRVRALVALMLLEAIRDHDLPAEVLEDENMAITLPRRLGLSGVIDARIRHYRDEAKRGRRVPDSEIRDLFGLVARRPDSEELFRWVGRELYGQPGRMARVRGILPRGVTLRLLRRDVLRRTKALFGRSVLAPADGEGIALEARDPIFLEGDPGGHACHLVTGLLRAALLRDLGGHGEVDHGTCEARGSEVCRWAVAAAGDDSPPGRRARGSSKDDGTASEGDRTTKEAS